MTQDRRDSLAPGAMSAHSPQLGSTKEEQFSGILNYDPEPSIVVAHSPNLQLNPNGGESTRQPQTSPNQATVARPKQKIMMSSTRRRGGRGRGGSVERGRTKSATPARQSAAPEATPKFKFNFKLGAQPTQDVSATRPFQYSKPVEEEDQLPKTSRSGRAIRKRHDPQQVYGSDFDRQIDRSSVTQGDDEDEYQPNNRSSTPSAANQANRPQVESAPTKRGRPSKQALSRAPGSSPPPPPSAHDIRPFEPDDEVFKVLDALRNDDEIPIDLPFLEAPEGGGKPQPYSSKLLTQLYILCYQSKLWDLCDLVADTWIRAFHTQRKQDSKTPSHSIWRPNKALERRKAKHHEAKRRGIHIPSEFDPNPPVYNLSVADPELSPTITSLDTQLLNELYTHTSPKCGARFLWADALALSGAKIEQVLQDTKVHHPLHPDCYFDIMQTCLRMVRRKLTLKIEESTEGAWCRRYHEHGKHGEICYREKAARRGVSDDDDEEEVIDDGVDREELERMEAILQRELAGEGMKRVRFGDVIEDDVDAEGESEDD